MPARSRDWRLTALVAVAVMTGAACGAGGSESAARSQDVASAGARHTAQLPVVARDVESCAGLPTNESNAQKNGKRLPNLTLPCLIAGPAVDLSELRGRPVVINLWATWCRPCRDEMPVLQDAQRRYGKRVAFVGVNTRDDPARAGLFLQEIGVTYPQIVDFDGDLLGYTRVPGLPVTIFLHPDGRIAGRHVGALNRERLDALIGSTLVMAQPHG